MHQEQLSSERHDQSKKKRSSPFFWNKQQLLFVLVISDIFRRFRLWVFLLNIFKTFFKASFHVQRPRTTSAGRCSCESLIWKFGSSSPRRKRIQKAGGEGLKRKKKQWLDPEIRAFLGGSSFIQNSAFRESRCLWPRAKCYLDSTCGFQINLWIHRSLLDVWYFVGSFCGSWNELRFPCTSNRLHIRSPRLQDSKTAGLLLMRQAQLRPVYRSSVGLHPNVAWAMLAAADPQMGEVILGVSNKALRTLDQWCKIWGKDS